MRLYDDKICISGAQGADVTGYRDYRGVRVVGAWVWLPEYDFGVATESDLFNLFNGVGQVKNAEVVCHKYT